MKTKTLIGLIIMLILLSVITSGCAKKPEVISTSVEQKTVVVDTSGNELMQTDIKIKGDAQVTTDCGDMVCFESNFKTCKPSKVTSKLTNTIIYAYEIIGPKEGLCQVKSQFLANPNPAWVGKEMNCGYDNSKDFQTAVADMSNCAGPLYSLMTGK